MKLLEQVRQLARVKHFSIRTERCYVQWAERDIRFHGIKHPNTMGALEIETFLTHLAVEGNVSASTQNQALAALLFLYQEVMKIDVGRLNAVRARRPKRVPLVLSQPEVGQLLKALDELPTTESVLRPRPRFTARLKSEDDAAPIHFLSQRTSQ